MKLDNLRFGSTILNGSNKAGLLKPDGLGYYTVVLGAFNAYNNFGEYYPFEPVRELFREGSTFMNYIKRQALRGEYDHPYQQPGQTKDQYLMRLRYIDQANVSHHISEVWVDTENYKSHGKNIVAVLGKIKPAGPKGELLEATIKNPKENVAFSVRSIISRRPMISGGSQSIVRELITYDYVLVGGIEIADKFYSPGLESNRDVYFSREDVFLAREREHQMMKDGLYAGVESHLLSLDDLIGSMGWSNQADQRILSWG